MAKTSTDTSLLPAGLHALVAAFYLVGCMHLLYQAALAAYNIRLYAIEEYGRVIHEFDPYFNYRAAEYLWQHGWRKFFQWFDYQSWYPLGRPVGTTIYPGMQFTSVWIKQFVLPNWSINDICCFVPAWFGSIATLATAALSYTTVKSIQTSAASRSILTDIPGISAVSRVFIVPIVNLVASLLKRLTGSTWGMATMKNPPALESAVFTAAIMAIVPAHLMRSVAGGYDNESVATTAMQLTFWAWTCTLTCTSLTSTAILGVISGICYFYMVAAWGGYVFVINLIGIHALAVFLLRKLPWENLYVSYTSFYLVGTILAMQIPVVGWAPLKSLEQLGPFGVFMGFQALQLIRVLEARFHKVNKVVIWAGVIAGGIITVLPVLYWLYTTGYFGPISSRIRGLFVKHTKTGNPLVDSVAEHQAANPEAYYQYLHAAVFIAPVGLGIIALIGCTAASSFLLMYGVTAYFFSHKMVRLILLTAPIASVCAGIALGYAWAWAAGAIFGDARPSFDTFLVEEEPEEPESEEPKENAKKSKGKKGKKSKPEETTEVPETPKDTGDPIWVRIVRLAIAAWAIQQVIPIAEEFQDVAERMARGISHPTIITKGRNQKTGEEVVVDDYREAYFWLADNTPEDARIMAWWDYGYQITGIGNRTTIADGNTWNHEHIALLGRTLTSPEKEAHRIARHLADYVLVWAGGGGDDLAKSPHLRRIANSVYRGLCAEPTCRGFGMARNGQPSKDLQDSLLFKLHSNGVVPGVSADRNRFREVFRSKYGKVRIYKVMSVSKESKEWVVKNRKCDAPGSWFCPGHYPPALEKILEEKKDFKQLEDFNVKDVDEEYQKQYFENLNKKGGVEPASGGDPKGEVLEERLKKLKWDEIELINEDWDDSDETSMMWEIISQAAIREFVGTLREHPEMAHIRSSDGRGPLWWAYEYNRPRMIDILKQLGVRDDLKDVNGVRPKDLAK